MAEAPSFRISMRSTAAIGIEFRSTMPPFRPCAAMRRPFSSTSVAAQPWPRRLAHDAPLLPRAAPATTSALLARLSRPVPLTDSELIKRGMPGRRRRVAAPARPA
jgi:hypothetical protein